MYDRKTGNVMKTKLGNTHQTLSRPLVFNGMNVTFFRLKMSFVESESSVHKLRLSLFLAVASAGEKNREETALP